MLENLRIYNAFDVPSAVSPDGSVRVELVGVLAFRAPAGVRVEPLPLRVVGRTERSWNQILSLVQESVRRSSDPVRNGSGHVRVDAFSDQNRKPAVVTCVS